MAEWIDALNSTVSTAADAYAKIAAAESGGEAEAQYYKGMNDALVYANKTADEKGIVTLGNLSISTSSILWIIGGTLGLLAIGIGVKKLV